MFNRAAERALGYAASEVIGKPVPPIHDTAELREHAIALGMDVPRTGPLSFEATVALVHNGGRETGWTYVARDGRRFPVLLTVNELHAADGRLAGFVGMARDVTERRAAEQPCSTLNRQLNRERRDAASRPTANWKRSATRSRTTCARRCATSTATRGCCAEDPGERSTTKMRRYLR